MTSTPEPREIPVLLIEDNPGDAFLVKELLLDATREGKDHYDVDHEITLAGGLSRLAAKSYGIILVDVRLPDSSGRATIDRLLKETSCPPIVSITGLGSETMAVELMKAGISDYMPKGSMTSAGLDRVIRNVLEAGALRQRRDEIEALKEEFVATASHEMRTPLAIIREFVSLVRDEVTGPISTAQAECLDSALRNCDRLAALINDTLDLHRIESGRQPLRRLKTDLARLILDQGKDLRPKLASKSQTLELEVADDLPHVLCDSHRIVQVLVNLVGNAHKFTPEGGWIRIRAEARDGEVEVAVSDNGRGISPGDQPRIFEKFAQAGRESGPGSAGTGLGLAIVKRIVEMHDGLITLESELERGSTFRFTLPVFSERTELEAFLTDAYHVLAQGDEDFFLMVAELQRGMDSDTSGEGSFTALNDIEESIARTLRRRNDTTGVFPERDMVVVAAEVARQSNDTLLRRIRRAFVDDFGPTPPIRCAGIHLEPTEPVMDAFERAFAALEPVRVFGRRVLIVDDDPLVLRTISRAFRESDLEVEVATARDGYEGLVKFGRYEPDVVVLDVLMPGLDGEEVIRQVKQNPRWAARRVIVMSGDPQKFERLRALGADLCLAKPLSYKELIAAVSSFLQTDAARGADLAAPSSQEGSSEPPSTDEPER